MPLDSYVMTCYVHASLMHVFCVGNLWLSYHGLHIMCARAVVIHLRALILF